MLNELKELGQGLKNEPNEAWSFQEVNLSDNLKKILSTIDLDISFFETTSVIKKQHGNNNLCYIPNQYFLYAVKIKTFATLLMKYIELFEKSKDHLKDTAKLAEHIQNRNKPEFIANTLDDLSWINFCRVFDETDSSYRIDAKKIFNSKKVTRSSSDFFSSVILKTIPVPDSSSSILGYLIYAIALNPIVYSALEQELSKYIMHAVSSENPEVFCTQLFSFLVQRNNLSAILNSKYHDGEIISACKLNNLFLVATSYENNDDAYQPNPITFIENQKLYVFLKKELLTDEETITHISSLLETYYKDLFVQKRGDMYVLAYKTSHLSSETSQVSPGQNIIFYGAPGTGKSFHIQQISNKKNTFTTVFHPDTQYSDFIGCLKPTMQEGQIAYEFRPGPFSLALIEATLNPSENYSLVIEEINRAPAAAVFGEIFQLLDRNKDGRSTYEINISDPDMLAYLNNNTSHAFHSKKLAIPPNLFILATMNSSDQAVMPLDTAFKRRWQFRYMPIDYSTAPQFNLSIPVESFDSGSVNVKWADVAKIINDRLSLERIPEDRLLGQHFLSYSDFSDTNYDLSALICGKLLMYLWNDVLKHNQHEVIFKRHVMFSNGHEEELTTLGKVISAFQQGEPIFNSEIESSLIKRHIPLIPIKENPTEV